MSKNGVRQDATASTRGTVYQLCVAVEACYQLGVGERLLIEELGDVTVEDSRQLEVKLYSDDLTDGHPNFWKTLRNWIDEGFDHVRYKALVLHTTQLFGKTATLSKWNKSEAAQRLKILRGINRNFESAYTKRRDKIKGAKPSKVLKFQRYILDDARASDLREIVAKIHIEAGASDMPELYASLKANRIRGVLVGKKDEFLESLIGFVCRANKSGGERWEISHDEFEARLASLTSRYCSETIKFPKKHFHDNAQIDDEVVRDDLFVSKIREIEYRERIAGAIRDFEATIATINEEFSAYGVDPRDVDLYSREVGARFENQYRIACRNCTDEIKDSKNFYDATTSAPATALTGFGDTPDGFRNGLLHQQMNEPDRDVRWKVQASE